MSDLLPEAATARIRVAASARAQVMRRMQAADRPPWLHTEAAKRMAERLGYILQRPHRVLDWSLAAGGGAPALHAACPDAVVYKVTEKEPPSAPRPPWWARWRSGQAAPTPVLAADIVRSSADLVWSCMHAHFENDPAAQFVQWHHALAEGGFVMFTTLGPGTLGPLRQLYTEAQWGEPFVPFVDMHDLGDMLVEAGLADPVMDQDVLYLTFATARDALDELRSLGGNLSPLRFTGLRTPRWKGKLLLALQKLAGPDGRITLPFELVHGHAFRAPDRGPAVTPNTRIELEDMRLMLRKRPQS